MLSLFTGAVITQIRYSVDSWAKVTSRKEKTGLGFDYAILENYP